MDPQISFLGGFALCDAAGRPVRLPTRKCWALLAFLVMSRGRDIPREELAALLWPRSSDNNARASLRQEMAVLRKQMAAAGLPAIESTKELVRLKVADDQVDALLMARLIGEAKPASLRQAVALYSGEFLGALNISSHPFEDWHWVERLRLKALAQNAYLQLLEQDMAGTDTDRAAATAAALLAVEPTQEDGHRALMQIYRRLGRRSDALQQFQRCADILQRELDTEPSRETADLAQRIRADMRGPRHDGPLSDAGSASGARADRWLPAPHADRLRTVVVLSASLAGIGDPDAAPGPRDLARALESFAGHCAQQIGAQGGRLIAGAGDAVLACFGYPDAAPSDLDHAISAARAIAMRRIDCSGTSLRPRVGVARGEVLVRGQSAGTGGAEVIGAVRRQAEDLAQAAQGGEIVISADLRGRIGLAYETAEGPGGADEKVRGRHRGFVLKQ